MTAASALAADRVFPYGAVYFRKSNPPCEDWERDHQRAAKAGMNVMRHRFMWSAIEVEPGKYDWRDYDRMLELEQENGIRVIIAEMITAAPEWAFDKYPHARYHGSDDAVVHSSISGSSATGGFPGLCLDNEGVRAEVEKFLVTLVERYRDHPALLGYDLWNENHYRGGSPSVCSATARPPSRDSGSGCGRSTKPWRRCGAPGTATVWRPGRTCIRRETLAATPNRWTG